MYVSCSAVWGILRVGQFAFTGARGVIMLPSAWFKLFNPFELARVPA